MKRYFSPDRDSGFSEQRLDREVLLAKALEKLEGLEEEKIDPALFADLYGPEVIEADQQYVQKTQEGIARDNERNHERRETADLGRVLEAIINDQVEQNEWLGSGVMTRRAADFDDLRNGVDMIAEIEQADSTQHLALAIDATYGADLEKKMDRIRGEIADGSLTTVKYFASSSGNFHGQLSRVPRVVVGIDKPQLYELIELWIGRKNKELAAHPVQLQIIDEIYLQLQSFGRYAKKSGQTDVAAIYDRQQRIIEQIRKTKEPLRKSIRPTYEHDDRVYKAIEQQALSFDV